MNFITRLNKEHFSFPNYSLQIKWLIRCMEVMKIQKDQLNISKIRVEKQMNATIKVFAIDLIIHMYMNWSNWYNWPLNEKLKIDNFGISLAYGIYINIVFRSAPGSWGQSLM